LLVRALLTSLHVLRDPRRAIRAFLRRPLCASTVAVPLEVPEPTLLPAVVAPLEIPSLVKEIPAVGAIGVASRGELAHLGTLDDAHLPPRDVGRVTLVLERDPPEAVRVEVMRPVFDAAVLTAAAVLDDTLGEIDHLLVLVQSAIVLVFQSVPVRRRQFVEHDEIRRLSPERRDGRGRKALGALGAAMLGAAPAEHAIVVLAEALEIERPRPISFAHGVILGCRGV
jgi:hypothetical protein